MTVPDSEFARYAPLGPRDAIPESVRAAAVTQLYEQNSALLYGLLLRILPEPASAQAVLVRVFREAAFATGDGQEDLRLQLVQRGRELAVAEAKRRGWELPPPGRKPAASVLPFCKESRRVTAAQAQVARLDAIDRQALEMAYFGGLTAQAIAQRLGLEENEVRTRLRRALCSVSPERVARVKEATP